jgi:DNA ligase-associated metallophosphoesterase
VAAAASPAALPSGAAETTVAGTRIALLPQRAAWLPEEHTLLVADAHIGKAHSFRRLGVPVPSGTTADGLQRLGALLQATLARRIVFLGDLLHAARGRQPAALQAVAAWRAQWPDVELLLVRGNHDRHAGDPPPDWRVNCVDEPYSLPGLTGLALAHHPEAAAGAYVLAGHVHPAVVLGGRAHQRLRLPCFHFGTGVGVLPAFGAFTGSHVLPRGPGDRIFAIAGDTVRALNSSS